MLTSIANESVFCNLRRGTANGDKNDVYDIGVILLEIIVGRVVKCRSSITVAKDLVRLLLFNMTSYTGLILCFISTFSRKMTERVHDIVLQCLLCFQLQVSLMIDDVARRSIVDPAIRKECSNDSLKTVMEICVRCLSSEPTERPTVEDVLWNLQFAAQVQDLWNVDSNSNQGSPIVPTVQSELAYSPPSM